MTKKGGTGLLTEKRQEIQAMVSVVILEAINAVEAAIRARNALSQDSDYKRGVADLASQAVFQKVFEFFEIDKPDPEAEPERDVEARAAVAAAIKELKLIQLAPGQALQINTRSYLQLLEKAIAKAPDGVRDDKLDKIIVASGYSPSSVPQWLENFRTTGVLQPDLDVEQEGSGG